MYLLLFITHSFIIGVTWAEDITLKSERKEENNVKVSSMLRQVFYHQPQVGRAEAQHICTVDDISLDNAMDNLLYLCRSKELSPARGGSRWWSLWSRFTYIKISQTFLDMLWKISSLQLAGAAIAKKTQMEQTSMSWLPFPWANSGGSLIKWVWKSMYSIL